VSDREAEIRRVVAGWPDPPHGWSALTIVFLLRELDRVRA
jgi:hypothetical protein